VTTGPSAGVLPSNFSSVSAAVAGLREEAEEDDDDVEEDVEEDVEDVEADEDESTEGASFEIEDSLLHSMLQ